MFLILALIMCHKCPPEPPDGGEHFPTTHANDDHPGDVQFEVEVNVLYNIFVQHNGQWHVLSTRDKNGLHLICRENFIIYDEAIQICRPIVGNVCDGELLNMTCCFTSTALEINYILQLKMCIFDKINVNFLFNCTKILSVESINYCKQYTVLTISHYQMELFIVGLSVSYDEYHVLEEDDFVMHLILLNQLSCKMFTHLYPVLFTSDGPPIYRQYSKFLICYSNISHTAHYTFALHHMTLHSIAHSTVPHISAQHNTAHHITWPGQTHTYPSLFYPHVSSGLTENLRRVSDSQNLRFGTSCRESSALRIRPRSHLRNFLLKGSNFRSLDTISDTFIVRILTILDTTLLHITLGSLLLSFSIGLLLLFALGHNYFRSSNPLRNDPVRNSKLCFFIIFFVVQPDDENASDEDELLNAHMHTPLTNKETHTAQSPPHESELYQGTGVGLTTPLSQTNNILHDSVSLRETKIPLPDSKESKVVRTPILTRSKNSLPATPPRRKQKLDYLINQPELLVDKGTPHERSNETYDVPSAVSHSPSTTIVEDLPSSCPLANKKGSSILPIYHLNKSENIYLDRFQKCPVSLTNGYLNENDSNILFSYIDANIPFKQHEFPRGDRTFKQPREHFWIGEAPLISGGVMFPACDPITYPSIGEIFKDIKIFASDRLGINFAPNAVFLTKLRDENDSFEYHDDLYPIFGAEPISVTLFLGSERLLIIRSKSRRQQSHHVTVQSGSVLYMGGESSRFFDHNMPKYNFNIPPQIAMSFKYILPHNQQRANQNDCTSNNLQEDTPPLSPQTCSSVSETLQQHSDTVNVSTLPTVTEDTGSTDKPSKPELKKIKQANKAIKMSKVDCLDVTTSEVQLAIENLEKEILLLKTDNITLQASLDVICKAPPTEKTCPLATSSSLHAVRLETLEDKTASLFDTLNKLGSTVESEFQSMTNKLNKQSYIIQNQSDQVTQLLQSNRELSEKVKHLEELNHSSSRPVNQSPHQSTNTEATHSDGDAQSQRVMTENLMDIQAPLYSETVSSNVDTAAHPDQQPSRPIDVHQPNDQSSGAHSQISFSDVTSAGSKEQGVTPTQPNTNNARKPSTVQHNRGRRKPRVLLLSDSRLNDFDPEAFSTSVLTEKEFTGTYDYAERFLRKYISRPGIDAYVLDLGINDLKKLTPNVTMTFAKSLIDRLLMYTKAKVVINLIPPTTHNRTLNKKVEDFNYQMLEFTRYLRSEGGLKHRVFTVFNKAFINTIDNTPTDLYTGDGIHLSEKGFRVHCSNIKRALFKSLNINLYHYTNSGNNDRHI